MSGLQNCVPEGRLASASATTTALRERGRAPSAPLSRAHAGLAKPILSSITPWLALTARRERATQVRSPWSLVGCSACLCRCARWVPAPWASPCSSFSIRGCLPSASSARTLHTRCRSRSEPAWTTGSSAAWIGTSSVPAARFAAGNLDRQLPAGPHFRSLPASRLGQDTSADWPAAHHLVGASRDMCGEPAVGSGRALAIWSMAAMTSYVAV